MFSFIIGTITNVIYIYIYIYIYLYQNENNTIFHKNSKGSKNINFFIKIIYNFLCIIKKYIKFENYYFQFKKTLSNPVVSTIQSKTPKKLIKKINKNYNSKKEREK